MSENPCPTEPQPCNAGRPNVYSEKTILAVARPASWAAVCVQGAPTNSILN